MLSHKRRNNRKKHRRTRRKRRSQGGAATKEAVIFIINNNAGFASVFNFLCKIYIYAQKTGKDFFIDYSDNWTYKYKNGWHDYFKTLKVYDPSAHYANIEKYSHAQTSKVPDYTLGEYTACIKEILVLNDDLSKRVQEYIGSIGGPYKAVYVRRGDKTSGHAKENDPIPVADIMKITDISKEDKVFIQTDDYSVIEEIKGLLPAENIFTLTPQASRGAHAENIYALSPEKRKEHAEELFMSFFVFAGATRGWTDNRSNMGRLHKLYSPDKVILYPIDPKSQNISSETKIDPGWRSLP